MSRAINQVLIEGRVVDLNDEEYTLEYSEAFRIRVIIADGLTYPDIGTVVRVVGYLCEEGIQETHRECKLNYCR